MADEIVSLLLEELCDMVKDKVRLLVGVEKEVNRLSSSYRDLQAVLRKAEKQKKQLTDETVRNLLQKLKGVAYEVEDIVDEWKICNCRKVHPYSLSLCLCFERVALRHNIGTRIPEITARLEEISRKSDFIFEGGRTNEEGSLRITKERQTGLQGDEFFGRHPDKERIIKQLVRQTNQEKNPVSIVTIVGMPGLGKTALAQQVCKDKRVKNRFGCIIWVCVSAKFDVHKIAPKVITQMGGSTFKKPDLDDLQNKLIEVVGRMRFLLVLDDVWDVQDSEWGKLRVSLKGAAQGSKIVVTTRNCKVATVMRTTDIHNLDILPVSDCLELFKHKALAEMEDVDCQRLLDVGKEIVESCKGIPLAVWAIGCHLRQKRETHSWKLFLKSNVFDFEQEILEDGYILRTFLLSYYNLPLPLKRCFSFCSVFPKNHEIKKDELVKLWMAHGIIKIEEIGEGYFEELSMHSLFHDEEKDDNGKIVKCKMHDLVHELANFVTIGDHRSMEIERSELNFAGAHHLSILVNCDVPSFPSLQFNAERLRTLLLLGGSRIKKIRDSLFKDEHLRFLRALDLSRTDIQNLPSSIGKLKHLRYLSLCDSKIKELPEFLTELCNLETLKLNHCQRLCTLPSTMSKMVKLRHLEIECTEELKSLPNGLGSLTSLRTLSKFPVGDATGACKIGELRNLNLLRGNLEIRNLERLMSGEEAREAELGNKSGLHSLSLHCEDNRTLTDDEMEKMKKVFEDLLLPHSNPNELKQLKMKNYVGSKFPWWLEDSRFSSSLVNIHLSDCKKCRVLPGLGRLPSLKYLKIQGADEVKVVGGEFYGCGGHGANKRAFPKLEELYFESMLNWEHWELMEEYGDVMPSLKKLEVFKCHKLEALPGILHDNSREIVIRECDKLARAPQSTPTP